MDPIPEEGGVGGCSLAERCLGNGLYTETLSKFDTTTPLTNLSKPTKIRTSESSIPESVSLTKATNLVKSNIFSDNSFFTSDSEIATMDRRSNSQLYQNREPSSPPSSIKLIKPRFIPPIILIVDQWQASAKLVLKNFPKGAITAKYAC